MKKTTAVFLSLLLTACLALQAGAEEAWEDECSPSLKDQIIEMAWWVTGAVEARGAEDWEREGFLLERIKEYSVEMFPDEVTWAWVTLGDLYAEGLYPLDEDPEITEKDMAVFCYEQARSVYEQNEWLGKREDDRYLDFQAALALKLGMIYLSPEWGLMDYEKALSNLDFAARLSRKQEDAMEAHYRMGLIYADEASGMLNMKHARNELYTAAHAGHEAAFQKVTELNGDDAYEWALYHTWDGDFETAIQIMIPAAEKGDVRCMEYLGYLYYGGLTGKGIPGGDHEMKRETEQAVYWYTKAAEAGSGEAAEWLANH